MTLDEIAIKHGCDKSSKRHNYLNTYLQYFCLHFDELEPLHLLEIGYGGYEDPEAGGESARMWAEWFALIAKNSSLTVVDLFPKINIPDGVRFIRMDQCNPELPLIVGNANVIIDDGSHGNKDTITTFQNLWPALAPGGLYFVEDTHSSYDPYYQDSEPDDPLGDDPRSNETAMVFFSRLSHAVNYDFIPIFKQNGVVDNIEFIHFYRDLIIIKKKAA